MSNKTAPRPKICVCGSINMDLVVKTPQLPFPGETILARSIEEVPGGKGANQAVGAARLGAEVIMMGRVGTDAFGSTLKSNLNSEGVNTSLVFESQGASGVAIVAVEDSGENSILVVPGANGNLVEADISESAIAACDVVVVQLEIPMPTVLHVIAVAKKLGKLILMNPAPAPNAFDDRLLDVDIFCPNRSEAERILHKKIENQQDAILAVQSFVRLGASAAIITLGEEGAVLAQSGKDAMWIPPCDVIPVDTTAAGDAFMAALAYRIARSSDLLQAVQFASAAGALATTIAGAQPSLPKLHDVEQLLRKSMTETDDFE